MAVSWLKIACTGFALVMFSATVRADGASGDLARLINAANASAPAPAADGDTLRLTPNKNEIIRLSEDAASVIVNNPAHAEVMLDSPRLLIVMPRQPGTTSFTVLNSRSETILQKNVIVTNVQPKYVRIRRMCASNDAACVPVAYYYCPDGCYEVTPIAPETGGGSPPPPPQPIQETPR